MQNTHSYKEVILVANELFDGDSEAATTWLNSPLMALGNKKPVDLMDSETGIATVLVLIGQLEHTVLL